MQPDMTQETDMPRAADHAEPETRTEILSGSRWTPSEIAALQMAMRDLYVRGVIQPRYSNLLRWALCEAGVLPESSRPPKPKGFK